MNGTDYSHLYQVDLDDYITRPLDGLTGDAVSCSMQSTAR